MEARLGWMGALVVGLLAGACGSNGEMSTVAAGSTGSGMAGQAGAAVMAGSVTGTAGMAPPGPPASLADCMIFPPEDDWNTDISALPADATWTQRIATLVGTVKVHPDFGDGFGIPINVVPATQPAVPIVFNKYANESDPGPYPFPGPTTVMIEGASAATCSGDCHVLVVQTGTCMLYEGYACKYTGGTWTCANGAKWDLKKVAYGQRKEGWTSADAAGLPIMPGILRYAEAMAGPVHHAVRFTLNCTKDSYVKPATHSAGSCNSNVNAPPMGLRVRLKGSYSNPNANPVVQNIISGLQHFGMLLADNGSNFYFQGEPNKGWTNDIEDQLKAIPASAFEVVAPSPLPP